MSGMTTGAERLARALDLQATACAELGSPLYGGLLRHAARDVEADGPLAKVLSGHEADPGGSALGLRLLGAVHRIVLSGSAPDLAAFYPSAGGSEDPGPDATRAWPAFRAVVETYSEEVERALHQAPQTNEPGRSAVLLGALMHVVAGQPRARPIRLFEIGASAGLNLRADHACVTRNGDVVWGDPASPFQLPDAWTGPAPPIPGALEIVERRGCDIAPVDPTSSEGRLTLLSYVWPDQEERFARLEGALRVASRVPAEVEHTGAAEFLAAVRPVEGLLTVVWHSVMWQYLPASERDACTRELEAAAAAATVDAPFAHIAFEPRRTVAEERHRFVVATSTPGSGEALLGEAHPHGIPVRWDQLDNTSPRS